MHKLTGLIFITFLALFTGCTDSGSSKPEPNEPPVLDPIADLTVEEGDTITLTPTSTDPNGDPVTYTYSGYITSSPSVAGAPAADTITITADDGRGGTDSLTINITVNAETDTDTLPFTLTPSDPWDVPFPSDIHTVEDADMRTGKRMNLPLAAAWDIFEEDDFASINKLDGFSVFPRITVPFSGTTPDISTFITDNIFLVDLSPERSGGIIEIDQRMIDQTAGHLVFMPDKILHCSTPYALVVLDGLTAGGEPPARSQEFGIILHKYMTGGIPAAGYEEELFDALSILETEGAVSSVSDILTMSVFTTQTAYDPAAKLVGRIHSGDWPVGTVSFDVSSDNPGDEIFTPAELTSIAIWMHVATWIADGVGLPVYSEGSITQGMDASIPEPYVKNLDEPGTPQIAVDPADIDDTTGSVTIGTTDVSSLNIEAGDRIILIYEKSALPTALTRPWHFATAIGKIVFGSFTVPVYEKADGTVDPGKTDPSIIPTQISEETVIFMGLIPSGTPSGGVWPVAHYMHGGGGSLWDSGFYITGTQLAENGIASFAFTSTGHAGGPYSYAVLDIGGTPVVIEGIGRTYDYDSNGTYTSMEGLNLVQRLSDVSVFVKTLQDAPPVLNGYHLSSSPSDTYMYGISYGGGTTFSSSVFETNVSRFMPNVFGTLSVANSSMSPVSALAERIAERSLLNGPSPLWGGEFDVDYPLKRQPVQSSIKPSAVPIQRVFDLYSWKDMMNSTHAYVHFVNSGELRGSPAEVFIQIGRGDTIALNHGQQLVLYSGDLNPKTSMANLYLAAGFDGLIGEYSRHFELMLNYYGSDPSSSETANKDAISYGLREQMVGFFQNGTIYDPDPAGDVYYQPGLADHADIFVQPPSASEIEEMFTNPLP